MEDMYPTNLELIEYFNKQSENMQELDIRETEDFIFEIDFEDLLEHVDDDDIEKYEKFRKEFLR